MARTHCCFTDLTLVLLALVCVCTRKAHSGTYRTRIRTQLLFRPSLLGGVSCVYSRCSARDSTDSRLTDSAPDTSTARGGVSKIGPNGAHMETRRQLPDSPAISPPPYCTEFEYGDFGRRGHADST